MNFRRIFKKRRIEGAIEGAQPIVFFFGADNVGGATIADKQILAVVRIEKTLKRLTRDTIKRRSS